METEKLAEIVDAMTNARYAMDIPLPPADHLNILKQLIDEWRLELRKIYVQSTGDDPWIDDITF